MDRSGPTGRPQADQTRLENDAVAAYGPDAEARPETDPETQMHDPGMMVESRLPLDSAPAGHDPKLAPGARGVDVGDLPGGEEGEERRPGERWALADLEQREPPPDPPDVARPLSHWRHPRRRGERGRLFGPAEVGEDPAEASERRAAPRGTAEEMPMRGRSDEQGRRAWSAAWVAGAIGIVLVALAVILLGPLGFIVVVPVVLVVLFLSFGSSGGPATGA